MVAILKTLDTAHALHRQTGFSLQLGVGRPNIGFSNSMWGYLFIKHLGKTWESVTSPPTLGTPDWSPIVPHTMTQWPPDPAPWLYNRHLNTVTSSAIDIRGEPLSSRSPPARVYHRRMCNLGCFPFTCPALESLWTGQESDTLHGHCTGPRAGISQLIQFMTWLIKIIRCWH